MLKVIVAAFERYAVSNPLHPDVFPAIRKMEAEIVSMCLRMYNNPDGAGAMTSGGTESIVMAVKTYRDWAREVKGITEPEMWVLMLRFETVLTPTSHKDHSSHRPRRIRQGRSIHECKSSYDSSRPIDTKGKY